MGTNKLINVKSPFNSLGIKLNLSPYIKFQLTLPVKLAVLANSIPANAIY